MIRITKLGCSFDSSLLNISLIICKLNRLESFVRNYDNNDNNDDDDNNVVHDIIIIS